MGSVFHDIIDVGSQGTYDLLNWDNSKSAMANIHQQLDQIDQEIADAAGTVEEEVSAFDPGVMWTPLIISAMVILAVSVLSCCSICVFCWFIRYRKSAKEKRRKQDLEVAQSLQPKRTVKMRPRSRPSSLYESHYEGLDDSMDYYPEEKTRSNRRSRQRPHSHHARPSPKSEPQQIVLNNFNEETYQIINKLHRTMSQQRERSYNSLRPNNRNMERSISEKDFDSSKFDGSISEGWGHEYRHESPDCTLSIPTRRSLSSGRPRKSGSFKYSQSSKNDKINDISQKHPLKQSRYSKVFKDYGKHLKLQADIKSHDLLLKTTRKLPSKKLAGDLERAMVENREEESKRRLFNKLQRSTPKNSANSEINSEIPMAGVSGHSDPSYVTASDFTSSPDYPNDSTLLDERI